MPELEVPRKINLGLVVGGGAVVAVSAVGAYYIYSGDVLIDKYLALLDDYEREYKEFIADGELDEHEKAILQRKWGALLLLGKKIEEHGLIPQLTGAIAAAEGLIVRGGPWLILIIIVRWIARKYAPPGSTVCPVCGKDFHSLWRKKRHMEREHQPKPIDTPEARDAWDAINQLPNWALDVIAVVSGLGDTFWTYIGKSVTEIPVWAWALIIIGVVACVVIAIFFPAIIPVAVAALVL